MKKHTDLSEPPDPIAELHDSSLDKLEKIPWLVKAFGIWCIVAGASTAVLWALLITGLLAYGLPEGENPVHSLVMLIVYAAIDVAVAVLSMKLGVRLLKNNRKHSAAIARSLMILLVVSLLLGLMLSGPAPENIGVVVEILVLIALPVYLDPSLIEERRLRRTLRKMDERDAEQERLAWLAKTGGKAPYKLNYFNIFWTFVVCSVLGLIIEDIFHVVVYHGWEDRAGLLFGPFSPIYGFGAVLMTLALNGIREKNPLLIFLCSALIGGAFEYFTSWFMQFAFGVTAWDYTGSFLSIGGRTNGFFMLCWGILGVVWIKLLLPLIFKLIYKIPWNWRYSVTAVATALMIVDGVMTLQSLNCWYERESGEKPETPVQQFYAKHFDDAYMANRFQTMTMNVESATRLRDPRTDLKPGADKTAQQEGQSTAGHSGDAHESEEQKLIDEIGYEIAGEGVPSS